MHFIDIFLDVSERILIWNCSLGTSWQQPNIVQANGLVLNRRRDITQTDDDLV